MSSYRFEHVQVMIYFSQFKLKILLNGFRFPFCTFSRTAKKQCKKTLPFRKHYLRYATKVEVAAHPKTAVGALLPVVDLHLLLLLLLLLLLAQELLQHRGPLRQTVPHHHVLENEDNILSQLYEKDILPVLIKMLDFSD